MKGSPSHRPDSAPPLRVVVTGASGFVGSHLTRHFLAIGHEVVGLARTPKQSAAGLSWVQGDVVSGRGLSEASDGADAVIHLVGIIRERGAQTFERVHVEGTRNVLRAAADAGVKRYLHMSALGAGPTSASAYATTKWRAEELVRASILAWTILRPDMILGQGDDFFSHKLRDLVTRPPVVPVVGSGRFPFRPITVHDVCGAFALALVTPAAVRRTLDLVGPRRYTLRELQVMVRDTLGFDKPLVGVPLPLMRLGTWIFGVLPNPPITREELAMLEEAAPSDPTEAVEALGVDLEPIEDHLAEVLDL